MPSARACTCRTGVDTIEAVATTTALLSPAAVSIPAARAARRDVQRSALRLTQTTAAAQRMAYRALAECWRTERESGGVDPAAQSTPVNTELCSVLHALADAVRHGRTPGPASRAAGRVVV
ncbi:hypothetical protein [Rhodococcus sp. NPDC057529]|uniref:hypothetical protein n=1 Tax=Rhodococcus sp. NPDC057529 TaxID=3346158 RepID=UPI003670F3B1